MSSTIGGLPLSESDYHAHSTLVEKNIGTGRNSEDEVSSSKGSLEPKAQSGIFGASANLANTVIGASVVGVPYALRESGIIGGLSMLLLVSLLTDRSLKMLVGLASYHPKLRSKDICSYEDLASYPFGKIGERFIMFFMIVSAYGSMLAYLLIIKDAIPSIIAVNDKVSVILILIATSSTIMLPLSMQRDMASLSITSIISIIAAIIIIAFITINAPVGDSVSNEGGFRKVIREDGFNPTLFIGLGILSDAMVLQHAAFIVSGSLENKTMKRWSTVTSLSIGASALLCAILGSFGYLAFLDDTEGDVLNNFDDSLMSKIANTLLVLIMFFTYPMESFVLRHVLVELVHDGDMEYKMCGPFNRRQCWSLACYVIVLLPAMVLDDVGVVLSMTGCIAGGGIAYCAPGFIFLGTNAEAFLSHCQNKLLTKQVCEEIICSVSIDDLSVHGEQDMDVTDGIISSIKETPKPCWWYLLGYPIWTKIAMVGKTNMEVKSDDDKVVYENSVFDENTQLPSERDYDIAIFFICFGVLSAVAGVASNVYVLLHDEETIVYYGDTYYE